MLLDRKRSPQFWTACSFFPASPKANLFTLWLPATLYSWDNPQMLSLFSPLSFPVSPSETTWRESYLLTWDLKVNLLPGDSGNCLGKKKKRIKELAVTCFLLHRNDYSGSCALLWFSDSGQRVTRNCLCSKDVVCNSFWRWLYILWRTEMSPRSTLGVCSLS